VNGRQDIGLTGGIACGKSALADILRGRGWHVIDTDAIAHAALAPSGGAYKKVVDAFGPSILHDDKSIDRKVLGRLVFSDPSLRVLLNEITHPVIRSVWQQEREARARTHPTVSLIVMIPLLYECALESVFPVVWAIGATRATQLARLRARGLSALEAEQRLASQLPPAGKMARAQAAFWGEGTLDVLRRQVDQLYPA
jgi:dephospho-CoA kinase